MFRWKLLQCRDDLFQANLQKTNFWAGIKKILGRWVRRYKVGRQRVASTPLLKDMLDDKMNRKPKGCEDHVPNRGLKMYEISILENVWDQHIGLWLWPGSIFIMLPISSQMFHSLLLVGHEPGEVSACSSWLVPPQDAHTEQSRLLIKGRAVKSDSACTSPPTADSKLGYELAKCHDRTAYQDPALILYHGYANCVKQLWSENIWCGIKISIEWITATSQRRCRRI